MNLRRAYWSVLTVICLIAFTNCGSSSKKTIVKVVAITATSGTPQNATVGAAFAAPLVATVTTGGTPTSGVTVTFTAPASGASGTFAGGANTAMTNASGVATSVVFTANTKAGAYMVTASAPGATAMASFSLTNNAGAAATITATSGTPQSATVSAAFAAPLVATVVDSNSNPVSGAMVTFTAPASGASGTFAGGANTATTSASGVATSAVFTANATAGGPYMVTAKVAGVATAANFSLTNTALVTIITATSGTPQSANVSTAFAAQLVATVKLGANPVSGAVVTFMPPASGASGTFAGGVNTATTNASGVATSAVFTANATAGGPYNVVATTPGAAAPANFSLTNLALVTTITATSGTPQSANVSTAFAAPLAATVKLGANPVSGAVVTFMPPASGASGTFAGGVNTATTNASGVATSAVFTANATAGGPYNVVATTPGAAAPANFSLTNTAVVAGTTNYVFYLSGADALPNGSGNYNFYALAGAITVAANGNVTGGVQDYNEGFASTGGISSPEPSGDTITGGTLTVSSTTGQGTLTLITNNTNLGVNGTETFSIQFVNTNHALIMQFDTSATSSGSMDVQSAPATPSGKYAFTYSGVDKSYNAKALGGVFSVSSGVVSGVYDQNDSGTVTTNTAFSGTFSAPDAFGRGSLTINGSSDSINYYSVNPKVARIIDVSNNQASVGSAYSQGAAAFTNASLPSPAVFTDAGNPWGTSYGAVGMFTTSSTGSNPAHLAGVADNNQLNGAFQSVAAITGNYSIAASGYGSTTVTNLTNIASLGIYMVDPTLNINDPNNTASGLGGALVLDLDAIEAGGGGVLVPQTSTATAGFTGQYAVGWQNFNTFSGSCGLCESDFLTPASMTGGVLSGTTGQISDPFETFFAGQQTHSGVMMSGTPTPDGSHPGHYTRFALGWFGGTLNVAIYQAGGGQLFTLEGDNNSVLLGPLEQQGSLTGLPAARSGTGNAKSSSGQ